MSADLSSLKQVVCIVEKSRHLMTADLGMVK